MVSPLGELKGSPNILPLEMAFSWECYPNFHYFQSGCLINYIPMTFLWDDVSMPGQAIT